MAARRALIVATGSYADPKLRRLRAPAADADKLAAVLKNPQIGNFEVDVALDQSESELRRRLARFTRDARRDDVLLFHFSCHGIKDDHGELYLAASDTELDLPDATAISAAWLSDQISRSPSRRTLLLLDCCFSGRFPLGATARGGDKVDVQDRFEGRGRAVISASNAMEYAYEGDDLTGEGRPSYFTQAVIDGLETGQADRDHDHRISVDELYDYVFERVKEMSPNQTPNKQIRLEGPLFVAHSTYEPPVTAAPLDPQLLALAENPLAGARMGAVEELARLLRANDRGIVLAARLTLEAMSEDDSRMVSDRVRLALVEHPRPEETNAQGDGGQADSAGQRGSDPVDTLLQTPPTPTSSESARDRALPQESPTERDTESDRGPSGQPPSKSHAVPGPTPGASRPRELVRISHSSEQAGRFRQRTRAWDVTAVAFSPDGTQIATASRDNTARVWEVSEGRERLRVLHAERVTAVAFSPNGEFLATASDDKTARLWSLADRREILRITHKLFGSTGETQAYGAIHAVAFSPDGTLVATGGGDRTARVWSLEDPRELLRVNHARDVRGVAFSPDGQHLATASDDKTARLSSLTDGRERLRIQHDARVLAVAFSPDGACLATVSSDRKARLWAGDGGVLMTVRHGKAEPVGLGARAEFAFAINAIAFSRDRQLLATASDDKTVRIWSVPERCELLCIPHADVVRDLAFSPDGRRLVSACDDKAAHVWEIG